MSFWQPCNILISALRRFRRFFFIMIAFVVIATVNHFYMRTSTPSSIKEFQPRVTAAEYRLLLKLTRIFAKAVDTENLIYFLYGGSLLGSYRHHGFIPWDDDIDVIMNSSQKEEIRRALSAYEPKYKLYAPSHKQWKFYRADSKALKEKPFRWPYIDIFFFQEDATHIWDEFFWYQFTYVYDKKRVFPLQKRPFDNLSLPAPCDTESFLGTYAADMCRTNAFSHKEERWLYRQVQLPCYQLRDTFPLVQRTKTDDGWTEVLWNGSIAIQYFYSPHVC